MQTPAEIPFRSLANTQRCRNDTIDYLDSWQHAAVGVATVANDRAYAEKILQAAERNAAEQLGGALVSSGIEWL